MTCKTKGMPKFPNPASSGTKMTKIRVFCMCKNDRIPESSYMERANTRNVGAVFACIPLLFSGATAKSNTAAESRFH